jgi:hypothetical protein
MTPASGRPSALPIPSMALISATAEPVRSRGRTAVSRLIPSGMAAEATPDNALPTIISARLLVSASSSDPAASMPRQHSSSSRRPYMSASRPMIGTDTAATSKVEVSSHCVAPAVVRSSTASLGSTGTTRVWVSADINAPRPIAAT